MINLLHISKEKDYFVFAANRVAGAKKNDKVLGQALVDEFVKSVGKIKIKMLICDWAFLDGQMISRFKRDYLIDMLVPLKKNMDAGLDAKGLAKISKVPWIKVDDKTSCYMAKKIRSWQRTSVDLNVILVKSIQKGKKARLWPLANTK